ncbi:MAG: hypothetical protein ACI8W8_000958 [Rhodothermales bacterium]|jgi:hypothetical protein
MIHGSSCSTLGLNPSFGFGDRIGLATPGHVEAMQRAGSGVDPIFPQQSIREMTRTNRTATQVMEEALEGMAAAGWNGPTGADADHLKTPEDVDITAEAGFTFFTIDPSGYVDQAADNYDEATLRAKFAEVEGEIDWWERYYDKAIMLPSTQRVDFSEEVCMRAAVKYGRAINEAVKLGDYIKQKNGELRRDYEIELSVDETDQPTTLAEHYIIAEQCLAKNMRLVSLAPRFIGDFEKGVDFKGDTDALDKSLQNHAAIADMLGPYKLSLHSGSDKLSMYTAFARATKGKWHVKTAGTSYLEALRVAAIHDESLFRRIIDFGRDHYETDKATYHVCATLDSAPPTEGVDLKTLEREYLECWDDVPAGKGFSKEGRQILHCTFGSVLTDPVLGVELRGVLGTHQDTYTEVLSDHFARHLEALQAGM